MKAFALKSLPLAIVALTTTVAANAQDSVTIYGLIDAGVTVNNHVQGGNMVTLDTGVNQASRLGFKGSEDLGDGRKARFTLENGFSLDTGVAGQGGTLFGREASVGLFDPRYGEIALGRMFDVMGTIFPAYALASNTPAGLLAWSLPMYAAGSTSSTSGAIVGALNNRVSGSAVNNSIRYRSPNWGGLSVMATYALGEQAGQSSVVGSTFSGAVSYANGPWSGSVGTYVQRNASTTSGNIDEYALGAAYQLEGARLFGMVSQVGYSAGTKAQATTYELGATYNLGAAWILGGGVQAQKRRDMGSAEQVTLTLDRLLSKRTDVYLVLASGHDHQFADVAEAVQGYMADGSTQTAFRIGLKHRF